MPTIADLDAAYAKLRTVTRGTTVKSSDHNDVKSFMQILTEMIDAGEIGGGGSGDATSIQGTPVDSTAPTDGQLLGFLGADGKWHALDPDMNLIKVGGATIGATAPVPVRLTDGAAFYNAIASLTTVGVTNANLDAALSTLAKESGGNLTTLAGKDFATQTTLAALLALIPSALDSGSLKVKEQSPLSFPSGFNVNNFPSFALETGGNIAAIKALLPTALDSGALKIKEQNPLTSIAITNGNLDAKLSDIKSKTDNLDVALSTRATTISNFANETGGNLAAIKGKTDNIPAQGQALATACLPVVLPTAQISSLTPPAAITGFALETGGNLAAIKTDVDKIPSQGQALAAACLPVVLPVAQISTLTPPATYDVSDRAARLLGIAYGSIGQLTQVTAAGIKNLTVDINSVGGGYQMAQVFPSLLSVNTAALVSMSLDTVFDGTTNQLLRTATIFKPQAAVGIAAEATIWTPAAGKKFRLMKYSLVSSVAGNITIRDNTGGATILIIPSGAGGQANYADMGNGILSAAANNKLTAQGPALSTLSGWVAGTEE